MDDFEKFYPEINIETDDLLLSISLKKDYSNIKDLNERKKEFINDLNEFINEFIETDEFTDFMKYFD